jgi:hypothetical protein
MDTNGIQSQRTITTMGCKRQGKGADGPRVGAAALPLSPTYQYGRYATRFLIPFYPCDEQPSGNLSPIPCPHPDCRSAQRGEARFVTVGYPVKLPDKIHGRLAYQPEASKVGVGPNADPEPVISPAAPFACRAV